MKKIASAEEYLSFYDKEFETCFKVKSYPKIYAFYQDLRKKFLSISQETENQFFYKLSYLLDIDAQLQLLLEIGQVTTTNICEKFGMDEEYIIEMISRDKKSYYRELTGLSAEQKAPWFLIYLSEA